ncbi:MAG: tRNA (N6-threonylcarbamoyladenosine(37)-N6)-methyltransferase TrmO [Candidatus Geothermincolales bacterium]
MASFDERAFHLVQIGIIHSPYREQGEAPYQGRFSDLVSRIEVFPRYEPGLKDIERCTHLYVIYWADRASREDLQVVTPWGPEPRGVFACRSPSRPNPLNLCVVELLKREDNVLLVRGLDALDRSPLVDIKPYSSRIDAVEGASIGWFEEARGSGCGLGSIADSS